MSQIGGAVGPSNVNRALTFDSERSINWFPVVRDAGTTKTDGYLPPTPACVGRLRFPAGPVRGCFEENGRMWAVSHDTLYEVYAGYTAVIRGTVAVNANPATISSNGTAGHQLFLTSGDLGYIYDTNDDTLVQITDADFPNPCTMGLFVDSYFVALKGNSVQFNISALLDGLDWNGLDVAQASHSSDNKIAMWVNHRELWLGGTKKTEVWTNTGAANFPFAPIPGVFIEDGIAAMYSVANLDNTSFWLSQNDTGLGVSARADGYTPRRISTHAIERYLHQLSRVDDAIGFAYRQEGHSFYVIYLPQAETTLVYDAATGLWHERSVWNADLMVWTPWYPRCHCYAFGKHFVGSRSDGTLFTVELNTYEDTVPV